jgi:sensor histidine kinase YesM
MIKLTVRLADIFEEEKINNDSGAGFSLFFDKSGYLLSPEIEKINYLNRNKTEIMTQIYSLEQNKSSITNENVLIKTKIPNTEWVMLSVYPLKQIKLGAGKIKAITLLACIGSLMMLFFVTYRISSKISKRITNITKYISAYQNENKTMDTALTDIHRDEIGYLATSVNEMVERINKLIEDVYKANLDKKESELKALQAQINPHFLYNSLSAISRLSASGDSNKVEFMVRRLTNFYRMTLNRGKNIITIEGEFEQIKAYIDIYSVRKRDFFNVYYSIDPDVMEYKTVKVILQPFVENIFEHAIYNRTWPINILLTASKNNDTVIFTVIDDGIGIRPEKQSGLLTNDNTKSYGIKNVNERIQIQYGTGYGVDIYSKYGMGTVITIKIPINKQ